MGQTITRLTGGHLNGQANDLTEQNVKMTRHVLVTGGATVPFKELLDEVVTAKFLTAVVAHGFNHIHIQCGAYVNDIRRRFDNVGDIEHLDLKITVFGFEKDLKGQIQVLCRAQEGVQKAGVVIAHAGTGTIADVLESEVAMITVANPNLMDNHQSEFASEIAAEHETIIQGHLGKLHDALPEIKGVIAAQGLDDAEPLEEVLLPVNEEDRLNIVDQVIASGFV